jgi:hypothetical protein
MPQLHVGGRTHHGDAERQKHGTPPGQTASGADDRTHVPRNGYLVGVRIALPIANGGHEGTP